VQQFVDSYRFLNVLYIHAGPPSGAEAWGGGTKGLQSHGDPAAAGSAEPGPLEEEEEEAGLRVWAVGAEKTKPELVPALATETGAADIAGPPDPPDFWANRVPEEHRRHRITHTHKQAFDQRHH